MNIKEKAVSVDALLEAAYPEAECGLKYSGDHFALFVMAILSAQCTDVRVNEVSVPLLARYPTAADMASADISELESIIRPVGLYHSKAKHLLAACRMLCDKYGGTIPTDMDLLLEIPGVGRKIANLLRGDLFGLGGIVADTHCIRISHRLGLTPAADQLKTEKSLDTLIPRDRQSNFCHRLVLFGREVCLARSPKCTACILRDLCVYPNI